jgi:hypothetical protein
MKSVSNRWQTKSAGGYPVAGLMEGDDYIYGWIAEYWGGPRGSNEPPCVCGNWTQWHPTTWRKSDGAHISAKASLVLVTE